MNSPPLISVQCFYQTRKIIILVSLSCAFLPRDVTSGIHSLAVEEVYASFPAPDRELRRGRSPSQTMLGHWILAKWRAMVCGWDIRIRSRENCASVFCVLSCAHKHPPHRRLCTHTLTPSCLRGSLSLAGLSTTKWKRPRKGSELRYSPMKSFCSS